MRLAENTGRKKSPKNRHLGTTACAQLCLVVSSQLRHVSTIGKKVVKEQYLLHMTSQYGERQRHVQNSLCVQVLRSRMLAALLYGTPAAGVSQTFRRGATNGITELSHAEGAAYIRLGGHHVGHQPTFYSYLFF